MRVLIIPESPTNDQYVLKPLIEAMLTHLGKPHAKVEVLKNPYLNSVNQALNGEILANIVARYRWVDLILLCVDRDGDEKRVHKLRAREAEAASVGARLLGENAWQELETWLLAGHDLPSNWNWRDVRDEISAKEVYYIPFAASQNALLEPGQGRKRLGAEAAGRYGRVRQLCPEDVANLESRVAELLKPGA